MRAPPPGPTQARAVWFTGPRQAELLAEEVRSPGPEEVLVRGVASLVSAGTEMIVYRGETRSRQETDMPTSAGEYPFPIKFSYQIVGEVEQAGERSGFAVGDRVFAYHPHQSRFTMASGRIGGGLLAPSGRTLLFAVPDALDNDHAVFANLFGVALTCLLDVPVRIGDCVAVSGLGVVGSFAGHFARKTAGRLILVDPLASRRERAAWIGADAVVHPDDAAAAIEEHTDGRGVDIYIEASGAPRALQGAIEGTGKEGTVAVLAYYGGNKPVPLTLAPEFHIRRLKIVSSQNAMVGSGLQPRWDTERRMGVVMEQLAAIDSARLISHRFPFERAPEAYRLLDEHPDDAFGVILDYQQEA
jgi:2-desacetyl-2-hydroxyethyl bacteriochlorophyllide A dehydrogenase